MIIRITIILTMITPIIITTIIIQKNRENWQGQMQAFLVDKHVIKSARSYRCDVLTHCGLVTPYGIIYLNKKIGSGNGLLPVGTNPLPEPVVASPVRSYCCIHLSALSIIRSYNTNLYKTGRKIAFLYSHSDLPGASELTTVSLCYCYVLAVSYFCW